MFLFLLGGSLVFGAGLLAAASFSEGTLLALKSAAQIIGWLFVLATVGGLGSLQRGAFAQLGAATVSLFSGVAILVLSYFQWDTVQVTLVEAPVRLEAPIRHAVVETPPMRPVAYEVFDLSPKVIPREPAPPLKRIVASAAPVPVVTNPCGALRGLEVLQCNRCSGKAALAGIACRESARLEYCEGSPAEDAPCSSAIPSVNLYSPPG